MAVLDEQQLLEREAAFMKAHAPDTYGFVLDQLRPSLYRLHAAGYSRAMLFTFLTSEGLVACGRATFYRWLKTQVDLDAGAREVLAARAPSRPAASVATGAGPATAAPPRPHTDGASEGGVSLAASAREPAPQSLGGTEEGSAPAPDAMPDSESTPVGGGQETMAEESAASLSSTYLSTVESTEATDSSASAGAAMRILDEALLRFEHADVGSAAARARSRQAASITSPGARDP
ncbi:hypothetical protein [Variovorax paradoxus]|uniref:hypothetical protein n=1 Tax=Variovorax paradoxus TaxID=34073 RepID=UPI001ABC0CA3